MNDRRAMFVACAQYDDPALDDLRTPVHDVEGLAEVLGDDAIGGFGVQMIVDRTDADVRREVGRFLQAAPSRSMLLLYFACHGRVDLAGRLYLASVDTDTEGMPVTSLSADLLRTLIDDSPARSVILLLDCCFSGAVSRASTRGGDEVDLAGALPLQTGPDRSRIIITATNAVEYAWEPGGMTRSPLDNRRHSVFAKALVDGLRTGAADLDGDGRVSIDDLYQYLSRTVRESGSPQTPGRFGNQYGEIYIARRPLRNPAGFEHPVATDSAPATPWSALLPWRAPALDWRYATDQVAPYVSGASSRAWQSLRAGFFSDAEQLFGPEIMSANDWSAAWGRGLCRAVRGDWPAAGGHFATAADLAQMPGLVAGAGILAVVTMAEGGADAAADILAAAHRRTPECPHLVALAAVERGDEALLGETFLVLPELAADLATIPLATAAAARAAHLARTRANRLERAWQRLHLIARRLGLAVTDDDVAPRTGREESATLATWVRQARSRRPAIAELAALLTVEIDNFLQNSSTLEGLDLATEARDVVAYAIAALTETDHPSIVRPLGIPPARVGN